MKRLLLGSCAMVFVLAAWGFGQDWKGFYVGGNAGGAKGVSEEQTTTVFSPTGYFAASSVPAIGIAGDHFLSPRGFTGGGQFGYNIQASHFVLGGEVDFDSLNVKDSYSSSLTYPCCSPTAFTVSQSIKTSWLLTARPRIGFTNGPVLVYLTGGLAMTNVEYKSVFVDSFATAHENGGKSGNQSGWTGGAGVEFKIGSGGHWSMKGEYLYADFGSVLVKSTNLTAFTPPIPFPTNVFTHRSDLQSNIFRSGINYRF